MLVMLRWGECPEEVKLYGKYMMFPSGMWMPSGLIAVLLLTHGLFDFKKFPDVPESAAARLSTYLCEIVFVVVMILYYYQLTYNTRAVTGTNLCSKFFCPSCCFW